MVRRFRMKADHSISYSGGSSWETLCQWPKIEIDGNTRLTNDMVSYCSDSNHAVMSFLYGFPSIKHRTKRIKQGLGHLHPHDIFIVMG